MKKVYSEFLKKWRKEIGITSSSFLVVLIAYLNFIGLIDVHNIDYSPVCEGTEEDPCYVCYNFTVKKIYGKDNDIFIYPIDYDPWGRNTPFTFDKELRDWKIKRWYGRYWYYYNLSDTCQDQRCGMSKTTDTKYSLAWREGKTYYVCVDGYKNNPTQDIKVDFNPSIIWHGINISIDNYKQCEESLVFYNKKTLVPHIVYYKKEIVESAFNPGNNFPENCQF